MAFFDSLIQREIEGWDSSSNDTFLSDSDEEQVYKISSIIRKRDKSRNFRTVQKLSPKYLEMVDIVKN